MCEKSSSVSKYTAFPLSLRLWRLKGSQDGFVKNILQPSLQRQRKQTQLVQETQELSTGTTQQLCPINRFKEIYKALKQRCNPEEETGSDIIISSVKEGAGLRKEEADAEKHLGFVRAIVLNPHEHQAHFYSHTFISLQLVTVVVHSKTYKPLF